MLSLNFKICVYRISLFIFRIGFLFNSNFWFIWRPERFAWLYRPLICKRIVYIRVGKGVLQPKKTKPFFFFFAFINIISNCPYESHCFPDNLCRWYYSFHLMWVLKKKFFLVALINIQNDYMKVVNPIKKNFKSIYEVGRVRVQDKQARLSQADN